LKTESLAEVILSRHLCILRKTKMQQQRNHQKKSLFPHLTRKRLKTPKRRKINHARPRLNVLRLSLGIKIWKRRKNKKTHNQKERNLQVEALTSTHTFLPKAKQSLMKSISILRVSKLDARNSHHSHQIKR
jgi:hypothetical protein